MPIVTPPPQVGRLGSQVGIGKLRGPGPEAAAVRWLGTKFAEAGDIEEVTRPVMATHMAKIRTAVCMESCSFVLR